MLRSRHRSSLGKILMPRRPGWPHRAGSQERGRPRKHGRERRRWADIISPGQRASVEKSMLTWWTFPWGTSARLATRLMHHGCHVSAVCPPGHVLRHVVGIAPIFKYGVARPRASLERALEASRPDVVIPCEDRVVWQLYEIHARRPDLRPLIEASLGPASEYPIIAHRERFLEVARSLGIRVPETSHLDSVQDVRAWFEGGATRAVLKRDGTWGGD